MNFAIFKNNKRTVRNTFTCYEAARQHVRRLIRAKNSKNTDIFWTSNPMIGDYGYAIRKVD